MGACEHSCVRLAGDGDGAALELVGVLDPLSSRAQLAAPLLLRHIVGLLEAGVGARAGARATGALFVVAAVQAIALRQYFAQMFSTGLRVKSAIIGATYAKLQNHPLATPIAQILGDAGAVTAMLATLDNAKAKPADRQTALRGLASQEHDALKGRLVGLLEDKALRVDSIRAMASYDEKAFSGELLKRYARLSADDKTAVCRPSPRGRPTRAA